jgi:hypothetical protein
MTFEAWFKVLETTGFLGICLFLLWERSHGYGEMRRAFHSLANAIQELYVELYESRTGKTPPKLPRYFERKDDL